MTIAPSLGNGTFRVYECRLKYRGSVCIQAIHEDEPIMNTQHAKRLINKHLSAVLFQQYKHEINFQRIKHSGSPFKCVYCNSLLFATWKDWKIHWWKYHEEGYRQAEFERETHKPYDPQYQVKFIIIQFVEIHM